jgi:hypothetical protein
MRDGWTQTTLGDVASVGPKEPPLSIDDPFVPMDAVSTDGRWVEYTEPRGNRSGARAAAEDVLFARITPCLENGKVAQVPPGIERCGGSTELLVIRPSQQTIPAFIYYWAKSASTRALATRLMTGSTGRQRLSSQDLAALPIILPPLSDQRRIVDLIESVDSYVDALRAQADAARTVRNSLGSELFDNEEDRWEVTTLGDLANLQIGKTPPRKESRYWTDDLTHPFCTIADMAERVVHPSREGVTQAAIDDGKARLIKAGTLLMSFKLTIGRVGFAGTDLFPNEAIVAIEPNPLLASPEFLYCFLGTQDLTGGSNRAVKGATLNSRSLAEIGVPLPQSDEQNRIVDLIGSVDSHISATEAAITDSVSLRSGVLSDLLCGTHEIPESYDALLEAS